MDHPLASSRPPRVGLRARFLVFLIALLAVAVLTTSLLLSWTARRAILEQTSADGVLLATLLARSAEYADSVTRDVEDELGRQMLVEATIAAHLIAIAERAQMRPSEVNAHLKQITAASALDEIWITDETGHALYRTLEEIDFTFSPEPTEQPQAHAFYSLLTGEATSVVQEARTREVDTRVFKYAGVAGVDRPRIVQVGYEASFLDGLRRRVGLNRLVDELVASGQLVAIRVVDRDLLTLAFRAVPGASAAPDSLDASEQRLVRQAVEEARTVTAAAGPSVLTVAAPIFGTTPGTPVAGATLVQLPTEHVEVMRRQAWIAGLTAVALLLLAMAVSAILARRVTGPVIRLTDAAAAVETETCNPAELDDIARRGDELGELARVFQRMAEGVILREQRLRAQLRELRVEIDEGRAAKQVTEITETDYFKELRSKAGQLRSRHKDAGR